MSRQLRVAVFASGAGTNLQAIIDASRAGELDAVVAMVLVNKAGAGARQRARDAGIPEYYISEHTHADPSDRDKAILEALQRHDVNLVALAGYLKKISTWLLDNFRGPMLNIHPSLLPAFGGKGMYGSHVFRAVLDYGVKLSGVTVHIVDEEYDHGPIVAQRAVPVRQAEDVESLAARTHEIEHQMYPEVLQLFADDRVSVEARTVMIRGES